MTVVPPAQLAHIAAILRIRSDAGLAFETPHPRRVELIIVQDDMRFVMPFEKLGRRRPRWRFCKPTATRGEEDLDLTEGVAEILRLLNEHADGDGPRPGVTGTATTKRDRGVEVRRTTVIRT